MKTTVFTAVAVVSWFIGLSQGAQSNFFYVTGISLLSLAALAVVELYKSIQD